MADESTRDASASNGSHATKAEHESLRAYVERRFNEQAEQLNFIAQQARLTGQAVELLLRAQGLDLDD
jgi:hypothetical protein